jgi:hypothetical protein
MCFVPRCVQPWRARTRGRLAIVIADNLRTHTPRGSKLVREMVADLHNHLRLIYTPAYDPDANRIEWLWRRSRREVTHNHQQDSSELLREDIRVHFQTLVQQPERVLRQMGSPFADEPPVIQMAEKPSALQRMARAA